MQSQKIPKQKEILRQIAQASAAIRRKHRMIKSGNEAVAQTMSDIFKPVVTPLHKLMDASEDTKPIKQEVKQIKEEMNQFKEELIKPKEEMNQIKDEMNQLKEELMKPKEEQEASFLTANDGEEDRSMIETSLDESEYLEMLNDRMRKSELDNICGVRKLAGNKLMVGDSPISFEQQYVRISDTLYPKTKGLLELLFKKIPDDIYVTPEDKKMYKTIVLATNAHKNYYESNKPVRSHKSTKLKNIMAELFSPSPRKRTGKGILPRSMIAQSGVRQEYVYWDDPNELVERLRLLLASQAAGNSSHSNEIMSVIEELREAGIIY